MRITLLATAVLVFDLLPAQDVLHYKFDGGCGADAINFAPGAGNATLVTTTAGGVDAARIPGRFGTALGGSGAAYGNTRIDTGWQPATTTGNFSFAMWLNNRPGSGSIGFGYLFGATGGNFRLFTGASGKLFLAGLPNSVTSGTDITAPLNAGWVHVACTVDAAAMQAVWYVDGQVDATVTLTSPVALVGTDFAIGARDTGGSSSSPLSTDEFLFGEAVWTPAEVLTMALGSYPRAASGDYTVAAQCGAGNVMLDAVGAPVIGGTTFRVDVATASPSLVLLVLGFSRCSFGGVMPLPLDAGVFSPAFSGCYVLANPLVATSGVTVAGTPFALPLVFPGGLPVITIYAQAMGLDLATNVPSMSNGLAVGLGM